MFQRFLRIGNRLEGCLDGLLPASMKYIAPRGVSQERVPLGGGALGFSLARCAARCKHTGSTDSIAGECVKLVHLLASN